MRNNFLFLILMSTTVNLHAQDCSGMKDAEVVRLDKDNGPLVNGRIQDQDGIGTCFANASSVALQTALPGNPDVSYLQLAFAHAQIEVAPKNKDRDSAFLYNSNGEKGKALIEGGQVCKTIEAAKNDKIGGVCKRDDVALEKSIFDPKTNSSKDTGQAQTQIIASVSNYYDSIKEKFGIKPGAAKAEIAARTAAFTNFQNAFNNLVQAKKDQWGQQNCLKPDTANVENVFKNMQMRVYTYLKNKYGDSSKFSSAMQRVKNKPNPDSSIYLYYLGMGGVMPIGANELRADVAFKYADNFKNSYMRDLNSKTPPKDAMVAFKNALLKADNKNGPLIDKLLGELSPEDRNNLQKDYNRYVKKDVSDCIQKNALAYYKSDDGLIKDFGQDVCLKNYLAQGKNLQSMAAILDRQNLNNIDSLNSFLTKLPNLNYEQAMSAILAPECSDDKKIKIPQNLKCESNDFNYVWQLRSKLVNAGKTTWTELEKKIKDDEELIKQEIDAAYPGQVAAIEAKYAGKDSIESMNKALELSNLVIEKNNRKARAHEIATARVPKQLAGADEPKYWNEYLKSIKPKFASDALSLLKNQKQAVPITLCTRMFTTPSATALRDGQCEQNSADNSYQSVGGFHAMAVIGVRCQKGKLNYLIQNSWGDWDSIAATKNADGTQHFDHEFGKAWMDEDEVMNNSYGYQVISK